MLLTGIKLSWCVIFEGTLVGTGGHISDNDAECCSLENTPRELLFPLRCAPVAQPHILTSTPERSSWIVNTVVVSFSARPCAIASMHILLDRIRERHRNVALVSELGREAEVLARLLGNANVTLFYCLF
jgi:hypothetical protein